MSALRMLVVATAQGRIRIGTPQVGSYVQIGAFRAAKAAVRINTILNGRTRNADGCSPSQSQVLLFRSLPQAEFVCRSGDSRKLRLRSRQPPMKENIPTIKAVAMPAQKAGPWMSS